MVRSLKNLSYAIPPAILPGTLPGKNHIQTMIETIDPVRTLWPSAGMAHTLPRMAAKPPIVSSPGILS